LPLGNAPSCAIDSVAFTLTVGVPNGPAIAVPAPFAPSVSTKYSAAVTSAPQLAASLTLALSATATAPLVGLGVALTALVAGPVLSGLHDTAAPPTVTKVSIPPKPIDSVGAVPVRTPLLSK
jgi:hypothetical protein